MSEKMKVLMEGKPVLIPFVYRNPKIKKRRDMRKSSRGVHHYGDWVDSEEVKRREHQRRVVLKDALRDAEWMI